MCSLRFENNLLSSECSLRFDIEENTIIEAFVRFPFASVAITNPHWFHADLFLNFFLLCTVSKRDAQ
jgi:hypothetical protein